MSLSIRRGALVLSWLFVSVQPAATARAEIVVLENGRFLKAQSYELEGEDIRIELENGGHLVMPLLRIDRVIDDELGKEEPREEAPREFIYLGFEPEDEAPNTPFGVVIFEAARRRNVNPDLVAAIIRAESAFDPDAVSPKGARGLMQLMPATGKRFGIQPIDLFDSEINVETGVTYLQQLIETYSQDLTLVLAAYNAGEGAVARHRGVPPYAETQEYIRRVYSFLGVDDSVSTPGK